MANPIVKDDLISQEALDALERMSKLLHDDREAMEAMIRATGQYAGSLGTMIQQQQQDNAALQVANDKIDSLEQALAKMQKMMAENKATQAALNAEKRKYAKLTEDEVRSVQDLTRALAGSDQERKNAIDQINIEKKSYNELYQTYNAIKDALNKMTVEERNNTAAGKAMTAQSLKIYETMNQLQQATGKFSMQVGKYRAAFDGLGYSFMQIMREAPSALNFDQFLLAISNNIPIFMDQAKAYVNGLKDDLSELQKKVDAGLQLTEEEMKRMDEAAKVTADRFSQVTGVIKRLKTAIFSTGGLTLLITMLLRYLPKIVGWIKEAVKDFGEMFKIVNKLTRELQTANAQIDKAMAEASAAEIAKLDIIVDRLSTIKRGTQEWVDMIAMVNETTGRHLSDLEAMPDDIRRIAQEWTDMQRKLAENAELSRILGQNDAGQMKKRMVLDKRYGTAEDRAALVGGENEARIAELIRYVEKYNLNDVDNMSIWQFIMANVGRSHGSFAKVAELEKLVDKELGIISQQTADALERRLNIISDPSKTSGGSGSGANFENSYKAPTMGAVLEAEANAMKEKGDTVLQEIQLWYEKRVAIANAAYAKEKEDIEVDRKDKEISLQKNIENAKIFIEKYNRTVQQLDKDHTAGNLTEKEWKAQKDKLSRQLKDAQDLVAREAQERARIQRWTNARYRAAEVEHNNQLQDLVTQEQEKRVKVYIDAAKREATAVEREFKHSATSAEMEQQASNMQLVIDKLQELSQGEEYGEQAANQFADAIAGLNNQLNTMNEQIDKMKLTEITNKYKAQEKVVQKRVRTINDEKQKNADLAHNIQILTAQLNEYENAQMRSGKGDQERAKDIEKLRQRIEGLQQQMSFTKQLSNYGSLWDIFERNGFFDAKQGTKKDIARRLLGDVVDSMSDSQISQVFDEWLDNLGSSISTWYDTTMGYIGDLMQAYADLAQAKAEAAAEATEAAQEEYEKEKALLEAGYASRVEATWAEYQEKKAAQEQAEKDAKAAAEAQQQLNELETVGSLVTASANIFKSLSAAGPWGVAAAIALIGGMMTAFIAAKAKAHEVAQYGEGGFEVLEGGSHASGHDIDLGVNNRRGRRMHVEGKEGLGIFRVKAMQHYGADAIENVVNGINHLEYEQSVGRTLALQRDMGLHNTMILPRTNLHKVESSLDKLVSYGSSNRYYEPDGTEVITTASGTTRIRRR